MTSRHELSNWGLRKLADALSPMRDMERFTPVGMQPPIPDELNAFDTYPRAAITGALGGGTAGVLLGALMKNNKLGLGVLGAGTGAAAALMRHYDQNSDPPGLSGVYTIPAGLRLGGLAGLILGGVAGKATGLGALKGAIGGALSGATGGALVSRMV